MNPPSLPSRILRPLPTREGEPLAATGRAGRNLPAAITTGVVLIAAVGIPLFFAPAVFVGVICLLILGALWELGGAFARLGTHLTMAPLYVGAIGMAVCAWTLGAEALLFALYATVFACVAWRILDPEANGRVSDVVSSVFAAVYVPFLASFVLLMLRDSNPRLILVYVALVVASDTGGWAAGVMLGKHPMAPRLSPKKSWEGFIGSALATIAVGVGCFIAFDAHWAFGLLAGIGACVIGTIGDLTESLIKRETGLKDMSSLLPGHGGLLDRLDALLMVAPFMHLVYTLAF
ncbi:MAG: phosphatidate cytidylyltransferase [Schaalia hyovaginalis]|uniref:phosphatidate cytidylyltransferase n=1 Tax=Schaalia hyovaginalis TaxID=29316 RepID=UPI002A90BD31|nr:phosphatidate cytidylyltransferase [Schaalia hyovaginalis]MDY5600355.1 phosphatidate cytidylyltransferase [Schaalia hyovaginalis]